jgi:septal ring factor EnvC (AmiA/AmiB activator)
MSLFPAETLLAVPARAEDTLGGVLVLRGLAGQLGQEAVALRREQVRLASATGALEAEAPRLAAALSAQQSEATALDRQIAAAETGRRQAEGEAAAAAQRAASEAARAETLRGVVVELDVQRRLEQARARNAAVRQGQEDPVRPTGAGRIAGSSQPHFQLTAPVAGTIVRSWGDATEGGPATGISYRTPPAARVVATCAGRVAFASPFRSYGLLLIVDCGGGYHAVLAGFGSSMSRLGDGGRRRTGRPSSAGGARRIRQPARAASNCDVLDSRSIRRRG